MAYLEPAEYLAYGLSADTADAWVAAASSMMDAHCRRTSLLTASYRERLPLRGMTAQLSYGPVQSVQNVRALYAKRADALQGWLGECAAAFGVPGAWVTLDTASVGLDEGTGEVCLPANLYGMSYSELDIAYTAGLTETPQPLKLACAQIVKNAQATPGLNVRSSRMDFLQTEYFSDSLLDSQVRTWLRPYVAERMG